MLDSPTTGVTPLVLRLPTNLNPADPNIRVRFDLDVDSPLGGRVNLWSTPVIDQLRNQADANQGGHRIADTILYSLNALNYDPRTGQAFVYVEGISENSNIRTLAGVENYGKPDERIRATFVLNGNDAGFDEVKYIVVSEDSFFYQLQNRRAVRNELASRGAYTRDDMPEFSLRRLDEPELRELGITENIAALLGPEAGHNIAGFNAMLYQDFITGEDQYLLTFRGTDDDVPNEWADWINNVAQGVGWGAPQYNAAMEIAFELSQIANFQGDNLVATGQSLGGGLASAAAVAGGIPAYTFNAAGLHVDTLYQRDVNGNFVLDGQGRRIQLYADSETRYMNARSFIAAYYVDYDILSIIQDNTDVPNAIGQRRPLVGPFDGIVIESAAIFLQDGLRHEDTWSVVFGGLLGGATMVEAHGHPAILFGLLGETSGYSFE